MAKYKTLDDFDVKNKVVLVRVDFNSEIDPVTKKVTSDVRIKAHAESTLKELAEKGAKTVVLAHQGRKGDPDYTPLKEHARDSSEKSSKCPVKYVDDLFGEKAKIAIKNLKGGEILVLENVRSWDKETKSMTPEEASKTELVQNLHRSQICLLMMLLPLPTVDMFRWLGLQQFCQALQDALWNVN